MATAHRVHVRAVDAMTMAVARLKRERRGGKDKRASVWGLGAWLEQQIFGRISYRNDEKGSAVIADKVEIL